jgi:hypothetical protein
MKFLRTVLALVVMCAACASARAQVEVSLPLDGYFRVGQYMPVYLRAGANAPLRHVTIAGDGLVPTLVGARGAEIVVPVLVTSASAREIVVTSAGSAAPVRLPLRGLPPDRQMIAVIRGAGDELGGFIPPAPTIVRVDLDRALVRAAPPVALEMLQSILLDEPSLIKDPGAWLASGVQVLLAGHPPPNRDWPWIEVQGLSLLRADPLGPRTALLGEDAYLPARGWTPARSRPLRRQVVLAGALFAIAATACALLPRRRAALMALALVTLSAIAAIYTWKRAHGPLHLLAGQVAVDHHPGAQWDRWTYFTTRASTTANAPFIEADRPILIDADQAERARLRLHWSDDPSGRYFEFALDAGQTLGFLSRIARARMSEWTPGPPSARSRFTDLARRLYEKENYAIGGEVEWHDGPVVVIFRKP